MRCNKNYFRSPSLIAVCIPDVIRENVMNHSKFSIFLLSYWSWIPWKTAGESHWKMSTSTKPHWLLLGNMSDIVISHRPTSTDITHVKWQNWVQRCYYITVSRMQLEDDICDTTNCIEAIWPKTNECSCINSCLLMTFNYLYLSESVVVFSVILFLR